MKRGSQPNRLPESARALSGRLLDRAKPLRFKLNGSSVHGFEGDTILTAALATGIVEAGIRMEHPLALDTAFSPPLLPRGQRTRPELALPMDRVAAQEGMDLVTLGPGGSAGKGGGLLGGLFGNVPHSLGHRWDRTALRRPWLQAPPSSEVDTDVAVIGGGIAGMSAAIAAAREDERVVLVERQGELGGCIRFFGAVDEEQAPAELVAELGRQIAALPNLSVMTRAEALGVAGSEVRVHQVLLGQPFPTGQVLTIKARRIVLAPGAFERLPVFPGNRLPGVVGALEAFHLAERYGVWLGVSTLFNAASSFAYRLALLAHDAGIRVQRLTDSRPHPQSRFIDFAKASGLPLAFGMLPRSVAPLSKRERGLQVIMTVPVFDREPSAEPIMTERLVVCGGWQPDLRLWHMAGGQSRWSPNLSRLEPTGEVDHLAIVGAAAGYRSNTACLQSGIAAIARFCGRDVETVEDRLIDPVFETPDAPTPTAGGGGETTAPAYLDGGYSLVEAPRGAQRKGLLGGLGGKRTWQFTGEAQSLSIGDIAAGVQLGLISEFDAGTVAQERSVGAADLQFADPTTVTPAAPQPEPLFPAYLQGRFGPRPQVWIAAAMDGRSFATGCLVYSNSDVADPLAAIGVVLRAAADSGKECMLLLGREAAAAEDQVIIRDLSGPVRAKLVAKAPAPPEAA